MYGNDDGKETSGDVYWKQDYHKMWSCEERGAWKWGSEEREAEGDGTRRWVPCPVHGHRRWPWGTPANTGRNSWVCGRHTKSRVGEDEI